MERIHITCQQSLKLNKIYFVLEEKEKMARLLLVDIVQKVLCEACGLLGMECPEEM